MYPTLLEEEKEFRKASIVNSPSVGYILSTILLVVIVILGQAVQIVFNLLGQTEESISSCKHISTLEVHSTNIKPQSQL